MGMPWQDYAGSGPGDLGEGQPGRAEIDGSIRPSWEGIIRIPLPASSWQPKRLDLFLQATEGWAIRPLSILASARAHSEQLIRWEEGIKPSLQFLFSPATPGTGELEDPEDDTEQPLGCAGTLPIPSLRDGPASTYSDPGAASPLPRGDERCQEVLSWSLPHSTPLWK